MKSMKFYNIYVISGYITIDVIDTFIGDIKKYDNDDCIVQAFNGEMIFGRLHLLSSIEHTLRAKEQGRLISHSLSMELLLYASGERQLKRAIPKIGIDTGINSVVVVIITKKTDKKDIKKKIKDLLISSYCFKEDPRVLEPSLHALQRYGITKKELTSIPPDQYHHLVLEKVAMVDIIK